MSIRKGPITTKEIDNATPYLSDIKGFPIQCPGIGFCTTSHHAILVVSDLNGTKQSIIEAVRSFIAEGSIEIIGLWEASSQDGSYTPEYRFNKVYSEDGVKEAFTKAKALMEEADNNV